MNEEIEFILDSAKESMGNAIEHLIKELRTIRAGKATPAMLTNVMVDYYGALTPLSQIANVSTPDPRTISVQPWEKNMLQPIEKAIQVANLGFNPMNNGDFIMINVPPLTEERRRNLVKVVRNEAENSKIAIRNIRRDANSEFKEALKEKMITEDELRSGEERVQNVTNEYVETVDKYLGIKETDLMSV